MTLQTIWSFCWYSTFTFEEVTIIRFIAERKNLRPPQKNSAPARSWLMHFQAVFVWFFAFFRMNQASKSTNICSVIAYFAQIAMKTSLNWLSWRLCELRISVASSLSDFRMHFFTPTIAFFVRDYDFELVSIKTIFFWMFFK